MKRKIQKRILAFIVALACTVSVPAYTAQAQEIYANDAVASVVIMGNQGQESEILSINPITTMFDCDITMAFRTEGLVMTFSTACLGTASVIGVKDIKVQQKMWYGWKTVFTSEGAEDYNEDIFMGELTYPDAVNGKTYRVTCVHYANYDVYEEVENDTGSFKFII